MTIRTIVVPYPLPWVYTHTLSAGDRVWWADTDSVRFVSLQGGMAFAIPAEETVRPWQRHMIKQFADVVYRVVVEDGMGEQELVGMAGIQYHPRLWVLG